MKKVEAIFPEEKLDAVKSALEDAGFVGMTIAHVKGRGQEGGILLEWRAGPYKVDFLPKILLMIIVPEDVCKQVAQLIYEACQPEDPEEGEELAAENLGKIFISPVDHIISIKPIAKKSRRQTLKVN